MLDRDKDITEQTGLIKAFTLRGLSEIFYQKSNFMIAFFLTSIFIGYLYLVMISKSKSFELADGGIKSLGTSFGFDQSDVIVFFASRTDEMITGYIQFNQIWDTLFGLTYGLMYVVWVSVLFKPFTERLGVLNLFPLIQVVFDWLENYNLVSIGNQYLADGLTSSSNVQMASVFSMIKWACSGLTSTFILLGILLLISRTIFNKK